MMKLGFSLLSVRRKRGFSLPSCLFVLRSNRFENEPNSWTTSFRMHDSELFSCLFGNDTLLHYLFCPRLWAPVDRFVGLAGSSDLLSRLVLRSPCVFSACRFYGACSAYHTSKASTFSHFSSWRAAFKKPLLKFLLAARAWPAKGMASSI